MEIGSKETKKILPSVVSLTCIMCGNVITRKIDKLNGSHFEMECNKCHEKYRIFVLSDKNDFVFGV